MMKEKEMIIQYLKGEKPSKLSKTFKIDPKRVHALVAAFKKKL